MKRTASAVLILLAIAPATALAQDAIVEGPGYKLGEGTVLHPSVGLEGGVVSNVFYEETDPVLSPVLKLLADLDVATLPPERLGVTDEGNEFGQDATKPKVDFRAGVRLTYTEYLTTNDAAQAQRDLGVAANAALNAFPQGKVSFLLADDFVRDVRPRNFESTGDLDRDINTFRAAITARPGGGAIALSLRYENLIDRFESDQSRFANRLHHTIGARGEWQFLPFTKLELDGSFGFYGQLGSGTGTDLDKVDSNPLRVQAGLATAITELFTVRVRGGYAQGFYESGADYQGPLIGVELGFRYSPVGRIVLSYDHEYRDSINANFYADHVGKIQIDQQFWRIMTTAAIEGRLRTYEGIPMSLGGATTRDDAILAAMFQARYVAREWLAITGDYRLVIDETDFRYDADGFMDDPSYVRHEVLAGVRAAF